MQEFWGNITVLLKEGLSEPAFQTFLASIKPISFSENILVLEVSNSFSKEWFKEKCEPLIKKQLADQPNLLFEYRLKPEPHIAEQQLSIFTPELIVPSTSSENAGFNPKYTFDSFVVGHNNRFAYAASEAVSKMPAKAYNPLFIYGPAGIGKTHLLHAICHKSSLGFPNLRIQLISSERFTNELINSIKDKKTEAFRRKYRKVDVLLVDDIQFLAGKEQTQEEFFHTFNELHSNNKQIVITSDRPPKEIPTLEVRLRTRFEWGLIADIQAPELETRIAILRKKSEQNNLQVADEILHFIAAQISSNVREMEGALTRVVAYASLLNTEISLSIASNVIRDMIGPKNDRPLTINSIKRKVCDYFSISTTDLCSKSRLREITYARQITMYLARELTNVSLLKIGETLGSRDHTTVMHACDKIKTMLANDTETQNIINSLITNIKND